MEEYGIKDTFREDESFSTREWRDGHMHVATVDLTSNVHIEVWRENYGESPSIYPERYFIEFVEEGHHGWLACCQEENKKPVYGIAMGRLVVYPGDAEGLAQMFDKILAHIEQYPQLEHQRLLREWEAKYRKKD